MACMIQYSIGTVLFIISALILHMPPLISESQYAIAGTSTFSSSFEAPWSFTLNASTSSYTCSNLRGNSSTLCFVPTSYSGSNSNSSFTLSILLSTTSFSYLDPQPVWTPNRNSPVSDGAKIELGQDGNLVLYDANGTLIWSSNTLQKGVSSIHIDAEYWGRLALYNSSNGSVWSSFDSPTDTLLQNQTLPSGHTLVSNLSSDDPSEGPYSLVLEPGGLVLYFDTGLGWLLPYWTYGIYGLDDIFSVLHTCKNPVDVTFHDYRIVFSEDSDIDSNSTSTQLCSISDTNYLVDYLNTDAIKAPPSDERIGFLRLDADGALRTYSWATDIGGWIVEYDAFAEQCLLPNICGPYGVCTSPSSCGCPQSNTSKELYFTRNLKVSGCVPISSFSLPSSCNSSRKDANVTFLELAGVEYVANQYLSPDLTLVSLEECWQGCLGNCSCKAAFYHNASRSCHFTIEQLWTMYKTGNQTHTAFIKVEKLSTMAASKSTAGRSHVIVIGVSVVSVFLMLLLVSGLFCWIKACRGKAPEEEIALCIAREEQDLDTVSFRRFSFKDLYDATTGFTSRKLGSGGFGQVFEGQLFGRTVAIKRLNDNASDDFRAEVEALGTLNHMNLVRLEGFCAEESHRLLVYEYLSNGSLDAWIFHGEKPLPWDTRLQIAKGIADCLVYLHEQTRDCILHLDIKPQNVLLDAKFCAKVSDFGLSKLLSRDATMDSPMSVRGTLGYIAPELLAGSMAIPKADVYSFGVVLWVLVRGQGVLNPELRSSFGPEETFANVRQGKWDEVVDPAVHREVAGDERRQRQVQNTMRMAYWCIQYDPHQRPAMSDVVWSLRHEAEVPDPPLPDTFQLHWADYLSSIDASSVIIKAVTMSAAGE